MEVIISVPVHQVFREMPTGAVNSVVECHRYSVEYNCPLDSEITCCLTSANMTFGNTVVNIFNLHYTAEKRRKDVIIDEHVCSEILSIFSEFVLPVL